ncbi:hypothetical protein DEV91_11032 [Phyllobacterium brassicacearum]|nr:hypothetical protein DEV91_11032 [Phyllobacterium brassicacearum]
MCRKRAHAQLEASLGRPHSNSPQPNQLAILKCCVHASVQTAAAPWQSSPVQENFAHNPAWAVMRETVAECSRLHARERQGSGEMDGGARSPGEGRARRRRRGQVLPPPPEITRGTASCSCRNSARLVMCLGGMGELRGSTALTTSPKTQSVDKSGPIHGGRGHLGARCYTSTRRTLFLSERHRYLCIFRVQEAGFNLTITQSCKNSEKAFSYEPELN